MRQEAKRNSFNRIQQTTTIDRYARICLHDRTLRNEIFESMEVGELISVTV